MTMESNEKLEKLNESIGFRTDGIKWVNVRKDNLAMAHGRVRMSDSMK